MDIENFDKSTDLVADFTSSLTDISNTCIPKTSTNPKKSNPWYNDDCKNAIRQRKPALANFCKYPTKENLNKVKTQRAKARRTIKSSKRNTWKSYVSKLNYKTPIKKVWNMIRKISGKTKSPSYTHLNTSRETKATSKEDIANTFGETFLKNSSARNYLEKFKNVQKHQEKNKINFKSLNNEEYNNHFNILELKDAIKKSHDTATGPDEIHYQMLKHLPENALSTLLHIFNDIWATGVFPDSWRLATVIPIPKPGKDHAEPTNYRPIALTSCLCKTLERMINKRLVWYLESNDLISPIQSGFRSERSTNDHLIRLETFIRDAFVNREHVVSVFFDLEKAYDTTWRYGILKDLHDLGLKGRLPLFIKSFLEDRTMQVRVGSTLSDLYDQEQGVPQGSILSTTLFNIKINNIVNCLDNKTDGSLYVDDFGICYRSKNMRTIERHLQQSINRIEDWATNNGFKFSKSKTQCVHFCKLRRIHNDPVLYLYGSPIPVVEETKFLGVIFDRKLSFIPHMYVDDFGICYRSKNMRTIERHLQQSINRIEDWATNNGFKFSKSKTQCVHFCKLRRIHNDPVLYLYGSPIPVVEETKFLGVIFDRKLSFIPHIRYIKAKCLKALNLLKVLSNTSWGGGVVGWSEGAG